MGWVNPILRQIKQQFKTSEHINNNVETAPSKRIYKCYEEYDKVLHGSLISIEIGLDKIRSECKIFDGWIRNLEGLIKKK